MTGDWWKEATASVAAKGSAPGAGHKKEEAAEAEEVEETDAEAEDDHEVSMLSASTKARNSMDKELKSLVDAIDKEMKLASDILTQVATRGMAELPKSLQETMPVLKRRFSVLEKLKALSHTVLHKTQHSTILGFAAIGLSSQAGGWGCATPKVDQ